MPWARGLARGCLFSVGYPVMGNSSWYLGARAERDGNLTLPPPAYPVTTRLPCGSACRVPTPGDLPCQDPAQV